jgi:hypothetical protein
MYVMYVMYIRLCMMYNKETNKRGAITPTDHSPGVE